MMTINREKKKLGIYIHIPYCIRKCLYCDFLSFTCTDSADEYFRALEAEIRAHSYMKDDYYVDTLFIGGGTPSAVDPAYISGIMKVLKECFDVDEETEITIEVNPGTLTEDKAEAYISCGINRLSMGVQSFDEGILKGLGRIHGNEDIYSSFDIARNAGFRNINIDLMFAVPGLTMDIWKETLEKAAELSPEHISFYSLQIEEGTPFGEMYEEGALKETGEADDRRMYHYAIDFLKEKGYFQYEISNAAKEGFYSRHNMKYWTMDEYLGLGLGASSYIRPYDDVNGEFVIKAGYANRLSNPSDMDEYIGGKPAEVHENSFFDDASEFVFTGLRRSKGISFRDFYDFTGKHFFDVFGEEMKDKIAAWTDAGYAAVERIYDTFGDERDFNFRLTPEGFDISNKILMEFV